LLNSVQATIIFRFFLLNFSYQKAAEPLPAVGWAKYL